MEQVAKYRGELEWGEIPMAGKTVEAASLLPEGFRPGNVAAVIVRHGARSYAACLRARVPATAEIVLDGSGQVCGIPAVAGGAPGRADSDDRDSETITLVRGKNCRACRANQPTTELYRRDGGAVHDTWVCKCGHVEALELRDDAVIDFYGPSTQYLEAED